MIKKLAEIFGIYSEDSEADELLAKDKIAELLSVNPEYLAKFEESYKQCALDSGIVDDNFFNVNSRQASAMQSETNTTADNPEELEDLKHRIVEELANQTQIYEYIRETQETRNYPALQKSLEMVDRGDLNKISIPNRPMLTGKFMKVDINAQSYPGLLMYYNTYLSDKSRKERKFAYDHFRQGLDILDLDEITYQIINTNKNSMGYWFPSLVEAVKHQTYFKIPSTTIVKVPITLLQLTRIQYEEINQTTKDIVNRWAQKVFNLDNSKEYFIKTGTYSSKFDFRNAYVHDPKEVDEIGEYLLFIHFQALMMASPLCQPCIYGVSTTTEWVVREFIQDKENNPTIYKGLPLHTEYRVFVDCDRKEVIGITPYWEPKTMKNRFAHGNDKNSPHQIHDYIIYKSHEAKLNERFNKNFEDVINHLESDILPNLSLKGQWSVDVMQNGNDFWIIDMALAENSAFYNECVLPESRNPTPEDWIPKLESGK